jgi:5'-nucleotidase/UDP-sugar diphosphatase
LASYSAAEYGGISRAASVIEMLKATEPNPILVHSGDFMVGTLMFNTYFGVPELQILNALGFDALCLGNHEFDVGPTDLADILATAQLDSAFDVICTNAVNLDSVPALEAIVRPYAIEQRGNLKIGLLGLTTPATNAESNPAPVVLNDQIAEVLGPRILELKMQGCQIVILLSHMGHAYDQQIALGLSGVDAIIGAHSHNVLSEVVMVNGIPIVQAGEFYQYVGKLRLVYDGTQTSVLDYELQEITSAIPAEPSIQTTVDQLKLGIIAQYNPILGDPYQQITVAPRLLNDKPVHFDTLDTPVGNLVTSAMLASVPNADCALEASGHIVENLYPGAVTTADLFRIYPYGYEASDGLGFRLASFDLSGAQILGIIQALLGYVDPTTEYYDYLLQSTGLDFTIDASDLGAGLQLAEVLIKGQPVYLDSVYTIVSSSQIVGYLEKLFGITPANLTIYPESVFQIVKEYVSVMDTLEFWRTGHNRAISEPVAVKYKSTGMVRDFELNQNYPNPFNGETVFRFCLSRSGRVSFEIYNMKGEQVTALMSGRMLNAGEHLVRFNAQGLASGIYLYRIRTANFAETRKMMMLQ